MEAKQGKAVAKYIRMSPIKVGAVLDLIRGKNVNEAMAILQFTPRLAAGEISKVLKSAVANAENNFGMDASKLYVSECFVCPGPTLKRLLPRAKGSADRLLKRSSHVTIAVKERA